MFKNYFKTAIRNLWRYRSYTLINIIGLGIAIAAMVWGYLDYKYSFSYDSFNKDIDHVYRGLTYRQGAEGVQGVFPMAAVEAAKSDFAGIADVVKLQRGFLNIKTGRNDVFAESVSFTDPAFFKVFNFPLVAGNNDLNDESAVLITEKTAEKYFGQENPLGKTLLFYANESYAKPMTVKGVLKNPPHNSTIQFDFITSFNNLLKQDGSKIAAGDWGFLVDAAFFKIPKPTDAVALADAMKKYVPVQNDARQDWKASGFRLISLRENASLNGVIRSNYLFERPTDPASYSAIILGILILLCACLNFSNTTVARSNSRLKEIGIRKVMGSTYRQLIFQMLFESGVIVFLAILVSVFLNMWWLPVFNEMFIYVDVRADYLHDTGLQVFLAAMLLGATLLAGAYPAFYISRYNPTSIFRGSVKFGGTNLFSRIMLGLQISISLIAVIGGIAFARNAAFQNEYDFGFNLHNTMGVMVRDKNEFNTIKNEVAKMPQVTALSGTANHIGFSYKRIVTESGNIRKETNYYEVGKDYVQTMNLKLVAGRAFNKDMQADYNNSILVSEKYAAMYGWSASQAIGQAIHLDSSTCNIVGVLKDFQAKTLFEPTEPVVMKLVDEDQYHFLVIQSKSTDINQLYSKVESAWKNLFPLQPFNGFYQDQMTAESYRVSTAIAKIFSWIAIITILLTTTGLFALISLTLLKRMREIAVRKVVGAKPSDIYLLVNKGYFWIILTGTALGCYAGWVAIRSLLDQIFRINVGVQSSTIVLSVITMILIALFTTGIKIAQAIRAKPVRLLRSE